LNGAVKMMITDLWNTREGWNPSAKTRVYATSPAGKAIVAWLYKRSKAMFSMLANVPLTEVLKIPSGWSDGSKAWALQVGPFRVKKEPKPGETINQYRARGGYLLYRQMFDGRYILQDVVPSWVGKHDPIDGFQLRVWVKQWTAANTVPPHTIRPRPDLIGQVFFQVQATLRTPGRMDRAMDWVVKTVQKLCNQLTSDKLQKAAAVVAVAGTAFAATPAGAAALATAATYGAIAASCGIAFPSCDPVVPPPPPAAAPPKIIPLVPSPPTVMVVPGTIAWYDKKLNQYRLATPKGIAGFQATHVETTIVATPPASAIIVDRLAWERATRPWYRRTLFRVAASIGFVAVTTTTALTLRRRSNRSSHA
jgi:hypothetical protein